MKHLRKFLVLSHRYIGIVFSLLIVMWFATGITMMYVGGMPRLTPELRLERMTPIDLSQVALTPAQAVEKAEFSPAPGRVTLASVLGRPAYRLGLRGETTMVYADTGEVADYLTREQTAAIAARFLRVTPETLTHVATLDETDQWTLGMGRAFPLEKFRADDGLGSEIYVSPVSGDVAMLTTRKTRAYAWVSTIPHWLYFEALRDRQSLWYQVVVWTAAGALVVALLGLVLGVTQYRRNRPTLKQAIPYSGWMRWHYVTGVLFGVFTATWAFSGIVSMEPWEWTNRDGLSVRPGTLSGGPLGLEAFAPMDPARWSGLLEGYALKEVEFVRLQGEPFYVARRTVQEGLDLGKRERLHAPYDVGGRRSEDRLIVSAATLESKTTPFTPESIVARVKAALPGTPIAGYELLTEYDSYYYSRNRQTPLPVVRIKFEDADESWMYVDPATSQVLSSVSKMARLERWLYNGLHSLDFKYLYARPLWDIVMLVLLVGGMISSSLGVYLGWKRLGRAVARGLPVDATPVPEPSLRNS